jgi:uncharacterized protein YfiM (DUF2279 family)
VTRYRTLAHVLALAVVLGASAPLPDRGRWFGVDRVKHFFVSFFVQSASYTLLRTANLGDGASLAGASAVTAAAGVSKELWDRRHGGDVEVGDLVWDALGAGVASVLLVRTVDEK